MAIMLPPTSVQMLIPFGAPSKMQDTRRFMRLTNAFSKKVENHAHSVALFAMYYNFVRIHKTLRTTPAMAAGVTKRLWEISDIVDVLEAWEAADGQV
jgi:hypothetical protein